MFNEYPKYLKDQNVVVKDKVEENAVLGVEQKTDTVCEWCGKEFRNLTVHKRFCKEKPNGDSENSTGAFGKSTKEDSSL